MNETNLALLPRRQSLKRTRESRASKSRASKRMRTTTRKAKAATRSLSLKTAWPASFASIGPKPVKQRKRKGKKNKHY